MIDGLCVRMVKMWPRPLTEEEIKKLLRLEVRLYLAGKRREMRGRK
jgi:hypothetical protein